MILKNFYSRPIFDTDLKCENRFSQSRQVFFLFDFQIFSKK